MNTQMKILPYLLRILSIIVWVPTVIIWCLFAVLFGVLCKINGTGLNWWMRVGGGRCVRAFLD